MNIEPNSAFAKHMFTPKSISDSLDVPRSTLYEYLKSNEGELETTQVKVGNSNRKLYDWNILAKISSELKSKFPEPQDKTKVFINQKGGVGKTTISTQFAMRAACAGKKVLFIDIDPQGHSTFAFGLPNDHGVVPTMREAFEGRMSVEEIIVEICPLLHLVPSNPDLSNVELMLRTEFNGTFKLKKLLKDLKPKYDLIVIDTNAGPLWITINGILCAEEICVVCQTEMYSVNGLKGMFDLISSLEDAYDSFEPNVRIIPNLYAGQTVEAQKAIGFIRTKYEDLVTDIAVRSDAEMKNAQGQKQAVHLYKNNSNISKDIDALTRELLNDVD